MTTIMADERAENTGPVVLVVDDEDPIRDMARRVLETGGYRVIEASNGADALAIVRSDAPLDLLMADIEMPELTGDEMARQIKALRASLKVLFVTGYADRLFAATPVLADDEAFLDKPFSPKGLLEAVSLLLYGSLKPPARA